MCTRKDDIFPTMSLYLYKSPPPPPLKILKALSHEIYEFGMSMTRDYM